MPVLGLASWPRGALTGILFGLSPAWQLSHPEGMDQRDAVEHAQDRGAGRERTQYE